MEDLNKGTIDLIRKFLHKLNNQMTALQLNTHLLMHVSTESNKYMAAVHRQSAELASFVNNVTVAFHTLHPITASNQPLKLRDLFNDQLLDQFQALATHFNTVLTIERRLPDAMIMGDPAQLLVAFRHLLDNAFEHSESDIIMLRFDLIEDKGVIVEIQDVGRGIDAHDFPHIFKPFYRSTRSTVQNRPKSGLGLTIARAIFEQHGGTLTLTSYPKMGCVATMFFPLNVNT